METGIQIAYGRYDGDINKRLQNTNGEELCPKEAIGGSVKVFWASSILSFLSSDEFQVTRQVAHRIHRSRRAKWVETREEEAFPSQKPPEGGQQGSKSPIGCLKQEVC